MAIQPENELQPRPKVDYAKVGKAALRPGVQFVLNQIQDLLNQLSEGAQVAAAEPEPEPEPEPVRRGRPKGKRKPPIVKAATRKSGWPDDPKERKKEMARRVEVARAKKRAEGLSSVRKREWAAMSFKQRKARLAAMAAGKRQHVNGQALAS